MRTDFENAEDARKYFQDQILSSKEAREYLGFNTSQGFTRAVREHKIPVFKEVGQGRGTLRLFLKADLEEYRDLVNERREKFNPYLKGEGNDE